MVHWFSNFFIVALVLTYLSKLLKQTRQFHFPLGTSLSPKHLVWNTLGQVSQQITLPPYPHFLHLSSHLLSVWIDYY